MKDNAVLAILVAVSAMIGLKVPTTNVDPNPQGCVCGPACDCRQDPAAETTRPAVDTGSAAVESDVPEIDTMPDVEFQTTPEAPASNSISGATRAIGEIRVMNGRTMVLASIERRGAMIYYHYQPAANTESSGVSSGTSSGCPGGVCPQYASPRFRLFGR